MIIIITIVIIIVVIIINCIIIITVYRLPLVPTRPTVSFPVLTSVYLELQAIQCCLLLENQSSWTLK